MSYLRKINLVPAGAMTAPRIAAEPVGQPVGQVPPLVLENPVGMRKTPAVRPAFPGGIAEGASLRTPCGLRRIEMVRPGDLVVTRDNGLQPVRLVWERVLAAGRLRAEPGLAPVCLLPRALGPMLPQNRVLLAPDQQVLVPGYRIRGQENTTGCLVRAADLAAGCAGAHVDFSPGEIRIFTLVFDSHQVFCANGLPVESFLANASGAFALAPRFRAELLQLFPRLRRQPHAYPQVRYRVVEGARLRPDPV